MFWALLINAYDHLAALGWKGDPNWHHNYALRPLLTARLLLLLFAVLMIPVVLAFDYPPDTFRMVPLMPVVYLVISIGLWQIVGWGGRLFKRQGGDGWHTSRWQAGEASESMLTLGPPANLPAADYQLVLIVYDQATLTPTVQTGNWQPEVTLGTIQVR